jgi:hypothetical protein
VDEGIFLTDEAPKTMRKVSFSLMMLLRPRWPRSRVLLEPLQPRKSLILRVVTTHAQSISYSNAQERGPEARSWASVGLKTASGWWIMTSKTTMQQIKAG